ncbi:hypothetical protein NKR23_g11928 [Pleurostoma richardsiae]|uniref:Uncharacterized protein n=1 Tax=Pleurostoma richardsiae TaxID=41990 RepID=A0AA38R312_9PEZI|nr:hypothetical protein NKR23_g11928 [Pleurostoma richardsiae]
MASPDFQSDTNSMFLDFGVNVSTATFVNMAFALTENRVHEQARLQFIVCVNSAAWVFLTVLNMATLPHLDISVSPELPKLQALICAAMMMQDLGYMKKCWQLNSAAAASARVIVASDIVLEPEETVTVRMILIKCYILDKALSTNMYPSSPPASYELDSSALPEKRSSHFFITIMLELASIQDTILRQGWNRKPLRPLSKNGAEKLAAVKERMSQVQIMVKESRSTTSLTEDGFPAFVWKCIDLIFFSLMIAILGVSPDRPGVQAIDRESLYSARQAVQTLLEMLDYSLRPSSCLNKCLASLAWVVPIFTPRPMFLLFANAVANADMLDFRRIQDLADHLEKLAHSHRSLTTMNTICKSLVTLYLESLSASPPLKRSEVGPQTGATGLEDVGFRGMNTSGHNDAANPSLNFLGSMASLYGPAISRASIEDAFSEFAIPLLDGTQFAEGLQFDLGDQSGGSTWHDALF